MLYVDIEGNRADHVRVSIKTISLKFTCRTDYNMWVNVVHFHCNAPSTQSKPGVSTSRLYVAICTRSLSTKYTLCC